MRNKSFVKKAVSILCIASILCTCFIIDSFASTTSNSSDEMTINKSVDYDDKLISYTRNGYKQTVGINKQFFIDNVVGVGSGGIQKQTMNGTEGIVLNADNLWVDFKINVEESGLYILGANFITQEGTGLTPLRKLYIDGTVPFDEAANIPLYRKWKDATKPKINVIGDEIKPQVEEIINWNDQYFYDNLGKYPQALQFYFTSGEHIVRLEYVDQPILISALLLTSPLQSISYVDYLMKYKNQQTDNFLKRFEAENALLHRSDTATGLASDSDPKVSPSAIVHIKMNTFGGISYRKGGQNVSFKVTVPTAGLYSINLRSKQIWAGKMPSYRQILINGVVPFKELDSVPFKYDRQWQNVILGGKKDPYQFYLNKGDNEISLNVTLGPNTKTLKLLDTALNELSPIIRKIVMITGTEPDPNFEYDLDKSIPSLLDELKHVVSILKEARTLTDAQGVGNATILGNNILSVITQLQELIKKPDSIPSRINDLDNMVTSIGDWYISLRDQALQLDYIEVFSSDIKIKDYHSNLLDNTIATLKSFYISFFKDYNAISTTQLNNGKKNVVLSIWIGRGKEWAEILKELADSDFTPKTGIEIKLNVLPSGQIASMGSINPLMLAIGAGKAPDVAMSVPSTMPVEYAIRNAVSDLSKMEGFDDLKKRFASQLMVPYAYQNGIYGVPETMYFRGLFYRKDILSDMNIQIPNTWDEVYNSVLPKLYENGMQMYIPGWYDMFLMSNNGQFYTHDGKRSALDTPEAYKAFKMLCDNYTVYGVPASANFFNRFRTGEMPIGVEGTGMYMQLIAAAPELMGRWAMAPIPGILQSDGTINRSTAGYAGESDVILADSQKQAEAYQFIDWWTSTKTQATYGREVEGRIGSYARWVTSNTEAFKQLTWNKDDLKVIIDSLATVKETPNVLGGYFTARHVANAWSRTVISGMSARDSLEQCVQDINTEIQRRQEQQKKK